MRSVWIRVGVATRRTVVALALLLAAAACGGGDEGTDDVQAVLAEYQRLYNARDANGIARLYADGGVLLPPGRAPLTGRERIARFWQGGIGGGIELNATMLSQDGAVGFAAGTYAFPSDSGKFMLGVVRDEDGTWRIAVDIWNANTPQ